ncbi:uncharacterized protein LOC119766231 [Culex quinquefasciatus]|uniref:uncharacterized protein LOC119766231 n=1 Tax=Culex quinquefasciatus TaxID=7176 RepID=UPI0018E2CC9A|nr:uncharacterized protein LOC119766231 [Culex quinquefasciatus]
MALPKRCVNNEIALKKINFQFLDKYEKDYFHDEEKEPTKRRTTKKLHNRRWSAQMLHSVPAVYSTATSRPQTLTSRRRSFSRMNHSDSEPKKNLCHSRSRITCSKSNSVPRASSTPCSGCASRIGNSPFRHFTFQPGNVNHPSRINGQLLQDFLIEAGNVTIVLHCCRASKPPSGTVHPGVFGSDRWRTV